MPGSRTPLLPKGQGIGIYKQGTADQYHSTQSIQLPFKRHAVPLAFFYET
jgi:hypothetical protein